MEIDSIIETLEGKFVGRPISKQTPDKLIHGVELIDDRLCCIHFAENGKGKITKSVMECASELDIQIDENLVF
jgi:hypothetical protein